MQIIIQWQEVRQGSTNPSMWEVPVFRNNMDHITNIKVGKKETYEKSDVEVKIGYLYNISKQV